MLLTKRKTMSLTEGAILPRMLVFILPLMLSNLLQILYNAADMMVVGLSSAENAVGAIGTTASFLSLIVNVFIGFSVGANVMVARQLGAKEYDRVSRTVHTSMSVSVLFGLAAVLVGIPLSRPILILMGAEEELLELAVLYTRIYLLGVPFTSVANYAIAILRAKGDTATPLMVLSLTGLANVGLNLFFVLVCGMSVEGVALATMIASLLNAVILVTKLARADDVCRFSFRKLCLDRRAFIDVLYVGLPSGVQSALFSLSNIVIQSSILRVNNATVPPGSAYQPVINGNSAAANLENFAFTAINAVHQGIVTFTGQNAGAGRYDRVKRILWQGILFSGGVALFFTLLIYFLRVPLFSLYGVVDGGEGTVDHLAFLAAYKRVIYHLLPLTLYGILDACNAVARGLKKVISATLITLIGTCLLRVVWIATVFEYYETLESIYLSYPLSWLLTATVQFIMVTVVLRGYLRTGRREKA
ncbi:MAG: polysaccharide biosynthesis C-terminal domain-containing protein [Clostridia bacterium]|nr:polysaccharide biosynthesis C-terminal domain-containing protein [Clostridia bacterium]